MMFYALCPTVLSLPSLGLWVWFSPCRQVTPSHSSSGLLRFFSKKECRITFFRNLLLTFSLFFFTGEIRCWYLIFSKTLSVYVFNSHSSHYILITFTCCIPCHTKTLECSSIFLGHGTWLGLEWLQKSWCNDRCMHPPSFYEDCKLELGLKLKLSSLSFIWLKL